MSDGASIGDGVKRMPGDEGVWFFISVDVMLFAMFFGSFSYQRSLNVALFDHAQQLLQPSIAALNTLFLLTSSWLVALAVHALRRSEVRRAARHISGAVGLGAAFVVTKLFEYYLEVRAGLMVTTNEFFMFYFVVTGIHLLHVVGGIVVLCLSWLRLRAEVAGRNDLVFLESGASFWHMVDLLWLLIFPLLYLIR